MGWCFSRPERVSRASNARISCVRPSAKVGIKNATLAFEHAFDGLGQPFDFRFAREAGRHARDCRAWFP